jgi:hypothetical protein
MILEICDDWISLEEIVLKTGKSKAYIRNSVFPMMIAQKKIEMLYPGTPNHPRQKYKKKQ